MSERYKQPGQANSKRKQRVAKQTLNNALAPEEAVGLLFPGTNINGKSHFCGPNCRNCPEPDRESLQNYTITWKSCIARGCLGIQLKGDLGGLGEWQLRFPSWGFSALLD